MLQQLIKLLVVFIFLGYIVIWILMPTNVLYVHSLPLYHTSDSRFLWRTPRFLKGTTFCIFFGDQGANILIFAVPVLVMACLSCLYLHLQMKYRNHVDKSTSKSSGLARWRRPAFLKGPLGTISWIELFFSFLFVGLLAWSSWAYLHGIFAGITSSSAAQMRKTVWEIKMQRVALTQAFVGNICLAFLFFPVTRASPLLRLFGLTSEASIKYHMWLGHAVMALFTGHSICATIYWATTHQISRALKWDRVGISNVAGEVSLVFGLAMWLTTFPRIRRNFFELFLYTHYLYVLFLVFYVFHVGFTYTFITLPGFYLFLVDRYLRFIQSQQKVRLVSVRVLPCKAVELNFSKSPGLIYNPSSIVFVNIPAISKSQWHPFTVTSNSNMDCDTLSVLVKSEGTWTGKLYAEFASPSPLDYLNVSLEGPYGPTPPNLLRHDMLVMVSGGSGITPFISIIRELLFIASTTNTKVPPVLLVTSFQRTVDLSMLKLLLPATDTTYDLSAMDITIEAYVTREKEPSMESQKFTQTLWLRPNDSDRPVYALLGSNNWIWLGAIILSSFIIFLVLIGLLTHYYLNPDKQSNHEIYSETSKATLSMLVMCVSIATSATIGFLWNKWQSYRDMKRIQNVDIETPMGSPGHDDFWHYNFNRELESFPRQSILQATNVHYGIRPNFKRILINCDGSSIGVMVSGPAQMRRSVARICKSGLTKNLHFESISFSW
ncbi:hypothetical protein DCAR_0626168 [Daucus carota subsp. sativus]|uniref:FAD-binding FR-type domain-containing protein n=1 Tax=Daucus carota subsp. sativus TaxID=79200 RepID=A0AAF1B5C0_DAUCS|nr:hypothetical protein DCAR_0626168 [Daucus carota subsp. sativus]